MKPEMILLVGNIGSGKTTICKKLIKEGYLIVSQDDLRYSIGAGNYTFNPLYEPSIKNTVLEMTKSFMANSFPIVIDETNMSKKIRSKYLNLAKIYGYNCSAIVFKKIQMRYAVKRRLKNNHGNTPKEVWEGVWKMFDDMYEKPTKQEGFNKITNNA